MNLARIESRFREAFSLHVAGSTVEAIARYRKLLRDAPDSAQLLLALGSAELERGRCDEAESLLRRSLKFDAGNPDTHSNLGDALRRLGRVEEAVDCYDEAVRLRPDLADAHNNRGIALHALGRFAEALASYDRSIEADPSIAEAHNNRGNALRSLGMAEDSLMAYQRAIELKRHYVAAYHNRAKALMDLRRYDEAVADCERATEIDAAFADAHCDRGVALARSGRHEQALEAFERALELQPGHRRALENEAVSLHYLQRVEDALERFDRAYSLSSGETSAGSRFNRAMVHLLKGDFEQGWQLYEWRWKHWASEANVREFEQPLWVGEQPLAGRTILLHAEQGLGDTLQFCRYVPMVLGLGARVVLEAQAPLVGLLASIAGDVAVVKQGSELPAFDFHCPLMSLPLAFRTVVDTVPSAVPYLSVPDGKRDEWRRRLGEHVVPRVGLAWSGSPGHRNDHNRSMPLAALGPLLALPIEFHSLQKEYAERDRNALGHWPDLRHHSKDLRDFTDTAALVAQMDLVVSVDTSVAHLAGALGRPLCLLLPRYPDFRWMLDRSDSPWYPTATLYRQSRPGDWDGVVAALLSRLGISGRSSGPSRHAHSLAASDAVVRQPECG